MKLTKIIGNMSALALLSARLAVADNGEPIPAQPRAIETSWASYFKDRSITPPDVGPKGLLLSPAPSTNFLGLDGWGLTPDTCGAVGRGDFVMTMLNTEVGVQTRGGASLETNSLRGFWTSTNIIPYDFIFDPRVLYDAQYDRWIASAATDPDRTNSSILIAVSRTSSPTNFGDAGWNLRQVKADSNSLYSADQPTLGLNKDWIVVQANMSHIPANGTWRSYFWVFIKTNLYAGNFTNYTVLTNADPSTNWIVSWSEVPAVTYDNSLSTLYLVQNANGNTNVVGGTNNSGYLRLFSITGAIGHEVLTATTNYLVATNAPWADLREPFYDWRCGVLPQTNAGALGAVPDARMSSVVYRNGCIWCAQVIYLPADSTNRHPAIQWWRIKPDTSEVLERGRIEDPNGVNFYCFPSIAVNRFNDVLIGYSSFSTNQYPSANYSFRGFDDPLGRNELRETRIYQPGLVKYGTDPCRWGDYSATVVDPINDADLWTIQEYALKRLTNQDGQPFDYWGTRWAQVRVDFPTNDNFGASLLLSGMQGTTNGTLLRATREDSEPSHAGNANTPSVWYHWTAPTNGNVAVKITGSEGNVLDSALAVYTGSSLGSLTLVTNQHGGTTGSQVVFNASSNTTYQIAVAGWNSAYGTFVLSWTEPSVPYFTLQPRGWDVYMGTNVTFTAQAIGAPDPAYQWRFNGTNLSGATDSTYTKTNVQTNDTGDFTVVATNTSGSATSQVAHLEVYSTQKALMTEVSYDSSNKFSRFLVSGITGGTYVVEASTNLVNWAPINTNITTFTNLDYDVTNFLYRFYRALYRP